MKPVKISGIGVVGGFGCGRQELLAALERGSSPVSEVPLRDGSFPLLKADSAPLERFLDKRALRRIDHFSRLALLGAYLALEDAGQPELDRSRLGVVIGSGFGAMATTFNFLDSVLDGGDACASPTAFSNSVHNAAAAHVSMQLKITGPSLTVSQFEHSLVSALISARQWLAAGRVDAVLLGVVDEYSPVLGYCWERYCGPAGGRMEPLQLERQSAVAGEGAAFFLLQPAAASSSESVLVDEVTMGRVGGARPWVDPQRPLLLGCNGFPQTGAVYRRELDPGQPVACYTPLYGASPVAQGFDLAVAALSLERGRLFPSSASAGADFAATVIGVGQTCDRLGVLQFGFAEDYGMVELRRGGA